MNKDYQLNDVVVFVNGVQVIKGVIDEKIVHQTQKEIIIRYFIRPYGRENFVEVDQTKIYDSFEEAREIVISAVEKTFTKEILTSKYDESIKMVNDDYNNKMETFEEDKQKVLDSINLITDKFCNDLENTYQNELKNKQDDTNESE